MIKPTDSAASHVGAVVAVSAARGLDLLLNDVGRRLTVVESATAPSLPWVLGETVQAQVLQRLPNDRVRVQIKGEPLTLQLAAQQLGTPTTAAARRDIALPPGAPGTDADSLVLTVTSLTPRLTFMVGTAASAPLAAPDGSAVAVTLSDAAKYTSALLSAAPAQPSLAAPAVEARQALLVAHPLAAAAQRAETLAQVVRQSGLFYESHVKAWAEGRLPLQALGAEPQAQLGEALKGATPTAHEEARAELGALLQRQLDAADGKPLAFSGLAWPGQRADWQIQRDDRAPPDESDGTDDRDHPQGSAASPAWTTQLRLSLPQLGQLGAHVRVVGSTVELAMTLQDGANAELFNTHRERLEAALQGAGLSLASFKVRHATEQAG